MARLRQVGLLQMLFTRAFCKERVTEERGRVRFLVRAVSRENRWDRFEDQHYVQAHRLTAHIL